MAKTTRLNVKSRALLRTHAANMRLAGPEKDLVKIAYNKLYAAIIPVMLAAYPPSDMRILEKYNCARKLTLVRLRLDVGGEVAFRLKEADAFTIPERYEAYHRVHLFDTREQRALFDAWKEADTAYRTRKAALLKAYNELIDRAVTFEAVVAVWPEADELRDVIVPKGQEIVILSLDLISTIKRDIAEREADKPAPVPMPRGGQRPSPAQRRKAKGR